MAHLRDYTPLAFQIDLIDLDFHLDENATRVRSRLHMRRTGQASALDLHGRNIQLVKASLDGRELSPDTLEVHDQGLRISASLPEHFTLEIENVIDPSANKELQGLYVSGGRLTTQCESEGFRQITYFLDRPDVLSRYVVRMTADKHRYPILLSNGELVESGDADGDRHFTVWRDPFPKPCYLFALVAGTFDMLHDTFTTASGREVKIGFYVDKGDADRARFALDALKRSMRWDEEAFGREYDLNRFNVVAVRDFNYGAMENKGLNIFNSSALMVDDETETDADFAYVERVVAHEYFHNWTGNRITLRDWFQLCLKEGLTVYRDQEFTADMNSRVVQRIHDVQHLRSVQFPEDRGPLSHPPRPDKFERIENFYTPTVYRKGAEVVRVLSALLGSEGFRRGMDEFFAAHDGQAVTVEQFVACFERANQTDLSAFLHWYTQAGTPIVHVTSDFDTISNELRLHVSQEHRPHPSGVVKQAVPIPLRVGFLSAEDASEQASRLQGENEDRQEHCLVLNGMEETWTFTGFGNRPVPAVLRGALAPVELHDGLSDADRLVQMKGDPDSFTRWNAGQSLMTAAVFQLQRGESVPHLERLTEALDGELDRAASDPALTAMAMKLPSLGELMLRTENCNPATLDGALRRLRTAIATRLEPKLARIARDATSNHKSRSGAVTGARALRNQSFELLASLGDKYADDLYDAFETARTMTTRLGALRALGESSFPVFDRALTVIIEKWAHNEQVVDKWFSVQATCATGDVFGRIKALSQHPRFSMSNPNRARSLYAAFAASNLVAFHEPSGAGYRILIDAIERADKMNPLLAGRFVRAFEALDCIETDRRDQAKSLLRELEAKGTLSAMQVEQIQKILTAV